MEAEKEEEDPFASIIKLCQPTASQEARFLNCPLARESENFADSNPDQFFSSPDPTPSDPTEIVMVSPPGSSNSVHQHAEDEAVFHTPPEHHHLSSSEDQNLNESCAEALRAVNAVDGPDKSKKVRVFGDDELQAKSIRVIAAEFDGETVPAGETEAIEMERNEGVHDTELIMLASADSSEEIATVNLNVKTIDAVQKMGELMKDAVAKVDATNGDHKLGKKCKSVEGILVNKGENSNENSDLSGSLDSCRIEEEIVKLKYIAGDRCIEVRQMNGFGASEKVVKITEGAKVPKDSYRSGGLESDGKRNAEIGLETDGKRTEEIDLKTYGKRTEEIGLKSNGKRIKEIDEFRYVGDVDKRRKGRTGRPVGGSGRRRELPVSLKGKEEDVGVANVVENVETKSGLLDFLDVLKDVFGDRDSDCEDVDFLEEAKRRGLTFPKARWWLPEGDDEQQAS